MVVRGGRPTLKKCMYATASWWAVVVADEGAGHVPDCEVFGNASAAWRCSAAARRCSASASHAQRRRRRLGGPKGKGTVQGCDLRKNTGEPPTCARATWGLSQNLVDRK